MTTKQNSTRIIRHFLPGLFLVVALLVACEPWDLDRLDFLEIQTLEVEDVTSFSATVRGRVAGLNVGRISEHGHLWSRVNENPQLGDAGVAQSRLGGSGINGEFTSDLFPIDSNSTYFYRAYAIMEGEPFYGAVETFQTGAVELNVVTVRIADLEENAVLLTGAVEGLPPGGILADHGFVWSTTNRLPDKEDGTVVSLNTSRNNGCFSQRILMDFPADTTFYVRSFVVTDGEATLYGNTLSFTRRGQWERIIAGPDSPAGFEGVVAFQIDNKVYFGTGYGEEMPTNRFWSFEAPPGGSPAASQEKDFGGPPLAYGVAFSINGKGYVGTGVLTSGELVNDFWSFNPQGEGSWTKLSGTDAFPGPPRWGAVAFAVNNKAYVGFGADESGRALNDFWVFEPGVGWQALNDAPFSPINAVTFALEGRAYVGLGITEENIRLKAFYQYEPGTDGWEKVEDFPGDARDAAVAFALQGKGYVGLGSSLFGALKEDFWAYDRRMREWKPVKPFEGTPRRHGLAFSLNDAGWVTMGSNFFQEVESDFWKLPGDEIEVLGNAEDFCPQ